MNRLVKVLKFLVVLFALLLVLLFLIGTIIYFIQCLTL